MDLTKIECKNDKEFDDLVNKLVTFVMNVNAKYTYMNYRLLGKAPNELNCQDFVDKYMNIKPNYSPLVKQFINKIRTSGTCSMDYQLPKNLRLILISANHQILQHIQQQGVNGTITFQTHKQLDDFVILLIDACPSFAIDYEQDYIYLKAFDRAFWLREMKQTDKNGNNNQQQQQVCLNPNCPFGHPSDESFI